VKVLNPRAILNAVAMLVAAGGAAMVVPAAYSLLVAPDDAWLFWLPGTVALAFGAVLYSLTRRRTRSYVSRQSMFLMVVVSWLGVVFVGAAPFLLSGLMGPVDAFFNSMAGFTTTGAATVTPEDLSPALLLWRSLSQWIGGIGVIVLFVAVAPLAGFGATQLYTAEAATPVQERVTPRIKDTVKVLAFVYGGLTLGGIIVLHLAGMGTFDAVNYALATVSTGGYSTTSGSVAAFDSWAIELAITAGMVLAGTNFAIYYTAARRGLGRAVGNAELLTFLGVILVSTILITADLHASDYRAPSAVAFREALFQSASLTTGTAFGSADWNAWPSFSQALLVLVMAVGGGRDQGGPGLPAGAPRRTGDVPHGPPAGRHPPRPGRPGVARATAGWGSRLLLRVRGDPGCRHPAHHATPGSRRARFRFGLLVHQHNGHVSWSRRNPAVLRRSACHGQDHARRVHAPGTPRALHSPGPAQPGFLANLVQLLAVTARSRIIGL
jgi:trk system potassium uptake protein